MAKITPSTALCLNRGSSSLKFAFYQKKNNAPVLIFSGSIENLDQKKTSYWMEEHGKKQKRSFSSLTQSLHELFRYIEDLTSSYPKVVVHRIVHGGAYFHKPTALTSGNINKLEKLKAFAPLHLPQELEMIHWVKKHYPKVAQMGCFDTAIYQKMPAIAKKLPFETQWQKKGLVRYGFHGISYESILDQLKTKIKKRTIVAHLGNGSSLSAFYQGKVVDTTMGFTPTGGVMMGSRSGDIDPGALLYFLQKEKYSPAQLEKLVNEKSGLKGVSGISENVEILRKSGKRQAKEAIDLFCYQVAKAIGSLSAALNGLDLLVFTGGIGENQPQLREKICDQLRFLGVDVDAKKNEKNSSIIHKKNSRCSVFVMQTAENFILAKHALKMDNR